MTDFFDGGEDDAYAYVDDGDALGDTLDDEDAFDDGDDIFFLWSYDYCPATPYAPYVVKLNAPYIRAYFVYP
nr:hypothetical protein CFP56_17094 [Quercus suber]